MPFLTPATWFVTGASRGLGRELVVQSDAGRSGGTSIHDRASWFDVDVTKTEIGKPQPDALTTQRTS